MWLLVQYSLLVVM